MAPPPLYRLGLFLLEQTQNAALTGLKSVVVKRLQTNLALRQRSVFYKRCLAKNLWTFSENP